MQLLGMKALHTKRTKDGGSFSPNNKTTYNSSTTTTVQQALEKNERYERASNLTCTSSPVPSLYA
jgi:hypothetical protein